MATGAYVGRQAAVSHSLDKSGKALHLLQTSPPGRDGDPVSVVDRLRFAMSSNFSRISDLFKDIDYDNSGTISKDEFRKVLPLLGLQDAKVDEVDVLFDSLDDDGSGAVEYSKLHGKLRVGQDVLWHIRRQKHISRAGPAYYCTPFAGMGREPQSWHQLRSQPAPTGRLQHASRVSHVSRAAPACASLLLLHHR